MTTTKGRKPNPTPAHAADGTTTEILEAKGGALALQSQLSQSVAHAFGDGTTYERERAIGQVRVFMAASAEAMLEAGKALIQIKENEPHGDFLVIVEQRLQLAPRTAQKMMAAAVKFLAPTLAAKAPTLALLGKSKLFELMVEDDEDLEQLADGGTLAGATLDEMQTLSARELRAALLEERRKAAAKDKVIAKKDQKLNALAEADEVRRNGAPNEREDQQTADLRDAGIAAELALRRLLAAVDEVTQAPATAAAELCARQTLDYVAQRLADMAAERGIAVDVLGEPVQPGWRRELGEIVDEAEATATPKARRAR